MQPLPFDNRGILRAGRSRKGKGPSHKSFIIHNTSQNTFPINQFFLRRRFVVSYGFGCVCGKGKRSKNTKGSPYHHHIRWIPLRRGSGRLWSFGGVSSFINFIYQQIASSQQLRGHREPHHSNCRLSVQLLHSKYFEYFELFAQQIILPN